MNCEKFIHLLEIRSSRDLEEQELKEMVHHLEHCKMCSEEDRKSYQVIDSLLKEASKLFDNNIVRLASIILDLHESPHEDFNQKKPIGFDLTWVKSVFNPLSFSLARAKGSTSILSKDLAIFEVNLCNIEGPFFTAKPQVSVTNNIMRINGIDKSFAGVSVINLVIPFLKLKTIFSLYTDVINSENGALIEKQLRDLFLKAEYRDSILIKLQSCSGYLEGSIVEYEDTFVAEFSIPPGLSKFLGSEKYCFIILIM